MLSRPTGISPTPSDLPLTLPNPSGIRLPELGVTPSPGPQFVSTDEPKEEKKDTRPKDPSLKPSTAVDTLNNAMDALKIPIQSGGPFLRVVDNATPQLAEIAQKRGVEGKLLHEDSAKKALDLLQQIASRYSDEAFGKEAKEALEGIAKDDKSKVQAHAKKLLEKKE